MVHAQHYTEANCANMMADSGLKPIALEGIILLPQAIIAKIKNRFVLEMIKIAEKLFVQDLHMVSLSRSLLFAASKS